MSRKIAMIGAGSRVFCKTLMSDIMATPPLADSEFALMSPTEGKPRCSAIPRPSSTPWRWTR